MPKLGKPSKVVCHILKKAGEYLDFSALYKEFEEKQKTIDNKLVEFMDKMGIWFKIDDNRNMTIYGLKK